MLKHVRHLKAMAGQRWAAARRDAPPAALRDTLQWLKHPPLAQLSKLESVQGMKRQSAVQTERG